MDGIVVWKLDRLGRSLKHLILTLEEFGALGVAETALTDVLITHLSRPELDEEIRRMVFRTKLAWARRMKLLPEERLEFMEGLASLRNAVAHNVSAMPGFSVAAAVAGMTTQQRSRFLHAWRDATPEHLRFGIWIFAMLTLVECEQADESRVLAVQAEEDRKCGERLATQQAMEREAMFQLLEGQTPENVKDNEEDAE